MRITIVSKLDTVVDVPGKRDVQVKLISGEYELIDEWIGLINIITVTSVDFLVDAGDTRENFSIDLYRASRKSLKYAKPSCVCFIVPVTRWNYGYVGSINRA